MNIPRTSHDLTTGGFRLAPQEERIAEENTLKSAETQRGKAMDLWSPWRYCTVGIIIIINHQFFDQQKGIDPLM